VGTAARRRVAEDGHAVRAEVGDGGVQVVDVERDVMSPDVAVAGNRPALVGRGVVEDLEDRLVAEAEEPVLRHRRPRVHVEVLRHPVAVVVTERAERVEVLAAEDVDEEALGLVEVRHGEAHVVEAAQSRQCQHDPLTSEWIQ
jgi:hypothetical protein